MIVEANAAGRFQLKVTMNSDEIIASLLFLK